jgi:outer membrane autotransporter protein
MGSRGLIGQGSAGRARRISCLLAGTALVSAAALSMSATDANAACSLTLSVVNCSSDTTTTDTSGSGPSDRHYTITSGTGTGSITATIDGFGFAITGASNQGVGVINQGAVVLNAGEPTAGGAGALRINGSGLGAATYSGTGTITANAGFGDALVIDKTGVGGGTVNNNGTITSVSGTGVSVTFVSGSYTVQGSGGISGGSNGVNVLASGVGNINVTSAGAIVGTSGTGIVAASTGGNVQVATGSTVSGGSRGIHATTNGNGTVTVTTGGAISGGSGLGIFTLLANGATTVNVGHDVSAGTQGIQSNASGAGLVDINHTAGTIAGGTIGIVAGQSGSGAIDISQTGGALNGTVSAVFANASGSANVIVSLTGGTVGNTSANTVQTVATTGNTTITSNVNLTSTATAAIASSSGSGDITIQGSATVQGGGGTAITASSTDGNIRVLGLSAIGHITATSTNGTVGVTATSSTNSYLVAGSITAVLPGGTINALSTSGVDVSNATGFVNVVNNTTITNAGNALAGSAAAGVAFGFTNFGTLNGNVNVTGSNVAASTFFNPGTWNAGTGNSTFSGRLNNTGTVNMQNGVAGQVIAVGGSYDGGGAYRIDVGGGTDRVNVSAGADLTGGAVNAAFVAGATPGSYTIFHADGGLGGTTFTGGLTTSALANFTADLSYTPTDVLLNLVASLGIGTNLNQNQQNVANTLNTFFNAGNALPPGFVTLFGLTGQPLATALTQLSGEHATGIQRATNLSTGLFLNAMLDPFVMGRTGGFGAGSAMGYAQETPPREAYAADMPLKAAPPAAIYEQRWSVWGAGYGGRSRIDGEPVIGSNDLTANAAGFAAGADYRVSPSSVIGAAFAIGETRWNVAGVGKGNADVAQVGGYASTRWNDLYVSGAVAIAWHDASTDRTLNIAGTDQLRADFNATSWGARLEGGYRYGGPAFGLTPYAAVQMQSVRTPDYAERATAGSNQFALSYVSESVIDTRTELGFWADARHALGNGSLLILRGRAAWVHDFNPDSRIQAAFQTLPGTSFVVDGAAAPRDAALTSAVAELRMANGVSLIGKFDGEFSGRSTTYAGTGTLRYAW